MDKKTVGKIIGATAAVLGTAFVAMSIVAKAKKGNSVYDDEPEQKNPLQGKKVVFVPDENDDENADGARGHLEAVGESEYKPGVYDKYFKRAIDIVLSFGGLVVLSPVYAAIALAIKIDDPGPVLFTQKRMGQNKEYFKLHKFRSMKMCTPHDVPTHMLENPEQYITKVGKFLRAHSLDELPQIWDIFIGNMSVIGPRPGLWNQDILTAERDKYGANDVKPGLTGWAQINGRDELEIPDKAKLDGEYVEKLGLVMDIKCFLGSVGVFGGDDSVVEGGTGAMEERGERNKHEVDGELILNGSIKVSIIMPAYNASRFIEQSIISVNSQTYPNWELIIVDDCSTDETKEIVSRYAANDKRIVYLKNEHNLGVAKTRNVGIQYATGKYIAFLDSDDLWTTDKLMKQVLFMEKNKCALSFTSYQKFDSETEKKGVIIRVPHSINAKEILGNTIIGCLTVMYNSEMVGKMMMPNLNHMEDNITWYNILSKGYTAYGIDEVLALYREGINSLTSSKKKAAIQQWNVYRDYFGFSIFKSIRLFTSYAIHAVIKHTQRG